MAMLTETSPGTLSPRAQLAIALEATARANQTHVNAREALARAQEAMEPAAGPMSELAEASRALFTAATRSTAAAGAVIRSEAAPCLLALDDAPEAELVNRWIGAKYLLQNRLIDGEECEAVSAFFRAKGMRGLSDDIAYEKWDHHPVALALMAAHRALMIDAMAKLPAEEFGK